MKRAKGIILGELVHNEICLLEGLAQREMNLHKNLVARTRLDLLNIRETKMYNVTAGV